MRKFSALGITVAMVMATALVPTPSRGEWVEWVANAEVERASNSNINNGVYSFDEYSDSYTLGRVALGRIYQIDNFSRFSLTLDAETAFHEKFDKLDYTNLGGTAVYRRKFGFGVQAPRLAATAAHGCRRCDRRR